MRRIQLPFERPGDGSSGYPLGDSANEAASFSRPKHLPWLIILVVGLTFSVDYLTAAQQQRLLKLTVTRHIMAALQEEADQPIDRSQRANWITPDADGNINGRISALDSSQDSASESAVQPENAEASPMDYLTVALVAQVEEVAKAKTDEKGRFELAGVEPGVYTLVGYGKRGFLAHSVHVLPRLEPDEEIDLDLDARTNGRSPQIVQQRRAWYVSHFDLPVDTVVAEELQIDVAALAHGFTSLKKISDDHLCKPATFSILEDLEDQEIFTADGEILTDLVDLPADEDDLKPMADENLANGGLQFSLSPAGHLHGRLQPIETPGGRPAKVPNMHLFLIQDDVEILQVDAEESGEFCIKDVEPGVYSLVAAGQNGFAAMSLELVAAVEAEEEEAEENDELHVKRFQPDRLAVNNIHTVSTAAANQVVLDDQDDLANDGVVIDLQELNEHEDCPGGLGIPICTDPQDLQMICQTVQRICRPRLVQNVPPFGGFGGGASGGFAPGAFAPGGFASAPASFAPAGFGPAAISAAPLTPAIGGAGIAFGSGAARLLGLAGLAGGIIAIADDSSSPPPAASPSTIGG